MDFSRWHPRQEYSKQEQFLMKRLTRTRKLFGFLRELRHELFDDEFQAELESMYRQTGAGKDPLPPALLAMVVLLQAYTASPTPRPSSSVSSTCAGRWCSTGSEPRSLRSRREH